MDKVTQSNLHYGSGHSTTTLSFFGELSLIKRNGSGIKYNGLIRWVCCNVPAPLREDRCRKLSTFIGTENFEEFYGPWKTKVI